MTPNNTQQEMIVWHKYPQEKPTKKNRYLIDSGDNTNMPDVEWWNPKTKRFEFYNYLDNSVGFMEGVIAWADLPTGWKHE